MTELREKISLIFALFKINASPLAAHCRAAQANQSLLKSYNLSDSTIKILNYDTGIPNKQSYSNYRGC